MKKIYASSFSALITEKDDLYLWGGFLGEIIEMYNPFDDDFNEEELNQDAQYSDINEVRSQTKIRIESVGLGNDFIVVADDYGHCYSWGSNE